MKRKALILVVDDNAECRKLLVWILEQYGFETISASDGLEAVELAIEFQPELVLMDLNMPRMNGYEATWAIHAHHHGAKIPVAAVSADCVEGRDESWFSEAGFIACLGKPWKQEGLLKMVTKVLANDIEPLSKRKAA
jgi:chemosensory pili system protein ChpA (sensor histidine kinase/response regulator)